MVRQDQTPPLKWSTDTETGSDTARLATAQENERHRKWKLARRRARQAGYSSDVEDLPTEHWDDISFRILGKCYAVGVKDRVNKLGIQDERTQVQTRKWVPDRFSLTFSREGRHTVLSNAHGANSGRSDAKKMEDDSGKEKSPGVAGTHRSAHDQDGGNRTREAFRTDHPDGAAPLGPLDYNRGPRHPSDNTDSNAVTPPGYPVARRETASIESPSNELSRSRPRNTKRHKRSTLPVPQC